MAWRRRFVSEDSHEQTMFYIWAEFNAIAFVLSFGLIYIGGGSLHPISLLRALAYAVPVTLASNIFLYAVSRGLRNGINALFGLARPVDQEELRYETLRDLAEAKDRRAEYVAAAELYRQLVDHPRNPSPEMAAYHLGEIYAQHLARPDDALYWYRKAMSIIRSRDPERFAEHALWPDLQRGIESFSGAKETDDTDFQRLIDAVQTEVREKRLDEAHAICHDLLRRYPANAESWFWAALVEVRRGLPARAIEHYYEAIARDPLHWRAQFNLGMLLAQQERFLEARDVLRRYLANTGDQAAEAEYIAHAKQKLEEIDVELTPTLPSS